MQNSLYPFQFFYIDNSSHLLALGIGYELLDPYMFIFLFCCFRHIISPFKEDIFKDQNRLTGLLWLRQKVNYF